MPTEKPKLPGTKGHHLDNPRDDGSVSFRLVGGKWDGLKARLYPQNEGHVEVPLAGGFYVSNPGRDKPSMHWKETA
jgi:hypothetical protein